MPLEIRQVVIRAEVEPQGGQGAASAPPQGDRRGAQQREDLVQEIVDQVMQVIDDRRAR